VVIRGQMPFIEKVPTVRLMKISRRSVLRYPRSFLHHERASHADDAVPRKTTEERIFSRRSRRFETGFAAFIRPEQIDVRDDLVLQLGGDVAAFSFRRRGGRK